MALRVVVIIPMPLLARLLKVSFFRPDMRLAVVLRPIMAKSSSLRSHLQLSCGVFWWPHFVRRVEDIADELIAALRHAARRITIFQVPPAEDALI